MGDTADDKKTGIREIWPPKAKPIADIFKGAYWCTAKPRMLTRVTEWPIVIILD